MVAEFTNNLLVPIEYGVLREKYRDYRFPKNKISRLVESGELIRLKKGLYLPAQEKGDIFSTELIANRLYGPSYVSLQTALAYYGVIPERVFVSRSMTTKRSREYQTPVGRFEYFTAKADYFSIGIRRVQEHNVAFLIASPEKALCDTIVVTTGLRIQSAKAMREYIEEDMRVDISVLDDVDFSIFNEAIACGTKCRELTLLKEYFLQVADMMKIKE
jgi:predicted transcriptional regulator of viral defense system